VGQNENSGAFAGVGLVMVDGNNLAVMSCNDVGEDSKGGVSRTVLVVALHGDSEMRAPVNHIVVVRDTPGG